MADDKKYVTIECNNTLDVEIGATPQQLLPLIETNNSLATSNKTLTATNAEQTATIAEQTETNEQLTDNNRTLTTTNQTLVNDILPTLRNGLQDKTVQPNEQEQVVTADEGYVGLKSVTVKQSEYVPTIGWVASLNKSYVGEVNAILDCQYMTSLGTLFSGATAWTSVPKLINTQNVTSMYRMFQNCYKITAIDTSSWDTSSVTSMEEMFSYCNSLKEIDVSNFNTSRVTTLSQMFIGCSSLKELDLSGFDTSNVTTIQNICAGHCSSLERVNMSGWNMRVLTSMFYPFEYTSKLAFIDFSGCHNCENVNNMSGWNANGNQKSYIGDHTLAEVEAGLTCLAGLGKSVTTILTNSSRDLRYSSMLALGNGIYDRTNMDAGTWSLSNTAFTYMRNDDDTIPDAATVTARQTKIREIAAAKNYTLSLS